MNKRQNPAAVQKQRQAEADSLAREQVRADSAAAEARFQRGRADALRRMNTPEPKPQQARDAFGRFIQSVAKALGMNPAADAAKKSEK